MVLNIITVSKMRDANMGNLSKLYKTRLQKYAKTNIIEVKESYLSAKHNESDIKKALAEESGAILKHISDRDYVVALAPHGKSVDSLQFSELVMQSFAQKNATVNFVIGSSYGLSDTIYERADKIISFSKQTFPHELFRVMLLEQLFRAFKIARNETYHK